MQVLSDEPVPPRQLQPKTPRDLETICLKCLEKQPARRYATAAELAEDLGRWQRGEPVKARPPSFGYVLGKWVRRTRAPLAAAAGVLLLLAAVVTGAFVQVMGARDEAVHKGNDLEIALHAKQEALNGKQVALNANRQTLDSLNEQLSILARSYADRSDVEYNREISATASTGCYVLTRLLRARIHCTGVTCASFSVGRTRSPSARFSVGILVFPTSHSGMTALCPGSRSVPDSRALVTASGDGTARLWDAASGKELQRFKHNGPVRAASFSPDANMVVTASEDGTARLWDAASGKELQRLTHGDEVYAASFQPRRPHGCHRE